MHGSLENDLDLVAVPWIDSVSPSDVLAIAIRDAVKGMFVMRTRDGDKHGTKPHGRRAFTIKFGTNNWSDKRQCKNCYIDLSVMPAKGHLYDPEYPCI